MLHFIGILTPEDFPPGDERQKPFFGSEWRLTNADTAPLTGKWPLPAAEDDGEAEDRLADGQLRFVSLLAPPFI